MIGWRTHGTYKLTIEGKAWPVDVARELLEERARRRLNDRELDAWAATLSDEFDSIARAKVSKRSFSEDYIRIEASDLRQ